MIALRSATFWVAVQAVVVFTALTSSPGFELIIRNDSHLYIRLAREAPLLEILGSIRTPGYPLLLRGVGRICPDLTCLPPIQLFLFCLAVVGLSAALRRWGLSRWGTLAAVSPLLYTPFLAPMAPSAMTDVPAAALALATLSLLLVRVAGLEADPPVAPSKAQAVKRWLLRTAFGLSLFLTYIVRPAYVFLVVLAPAAGFLLPLLTAGWGCRRRAARFAAGLAAWGLIPLLLWSVLRWQTVSHFGLVAFTGHNLSGIAASMLSDELVSELPESERGLAQTILDLRRTRGFAPLDAGSPYRAWHEAFILNSWRIAIPAARVEWRGRFRAGALAEPLRPRDMAVDLRLSRLSREVIRREPGLYLVWLGRAWAAALTEAITSRWIAVPALFALVSFVLWRGFRGRRRGGRGAGGTASSLRRSLGWLLLSLGFYLSFLGLLLLVEPPEWRYRLATELLLPGGLAAVAVELLAGLAGSRRPAGGP